jgi:hypothetical protein
MIIEMTTRYLTIKEAADRYQKAEITIRRLVRSIVKESQHNDRVHIQPGTSEANDLKKRRRPFSYGISESLLEKMYPTSPLDTHAPLESHREDNAETERELESESPYLPLLMGQLKVKDDQIRSLTQSLDALTERQRETNILMKGLQERLLLGSGQKQTATSSTTVTAVRKKPAPKRKKVWWMW